MSQRDSQQPDQRRSAGEFPWPRRSYAGKRTLDVLFAIVLLVISAPLWLLVAAGVKLTSRGPVFYGGRRAGRAGREFRQWKFRTMTSDAAGSAFTARHDTRVTPLGGWLRLLKIDELPQLINVLRGEMSIVGPRPEDVDVVRELYTREQLEVLSVRPGLTGPLQVRVFPDFTADVPPHADPQAYYRQTLLPARLQEDLDYVRQMSLALDLKVICQTAYCLLIKSWPLLLRRERKQTSAADRVPNPAEKTNSACKTP